MITRRGEFNFRGTRQQFERFRSRIPLLVANESRNHFLEGFRRGGGQTDRSRGGWPARRPPRSERQARRDSGRALLVLSGNMRSDIRVRGVSFRRSVINVVNIPYARYHNNGTDRIPQREFIGRSRALEGKIIRLIERELQNIN